MMRNNKVVALVLLLVLSAIWGSSFFFIKKGLLAFSYLQVGALRILIAGLVMVPVLLMNRGLVTKKNFKYGMLFGFLNAGLPAFLFSHAQQSVPSSMAGILNALTPLFNFVFGILFFHIAYSTRNLIGVIMGLSGAVFLVWYGTGTPLQWETQQDQIWGYMELILATACYGMGGHIIKIHLGHLPPPVTAGLSYIGFAPIMITILLLTPYDKFAIVPTVVSNKAIIYMIILGAVGSAVAIILLARLVQLSSALIASFVTYLIPFGAIAWGLADGETVHPNALIGLFIILASIALVMFGHKLPKRKDKAPSIAASEEEGGQLREAS